MKKKKFNFISGLPRSGSTLLSTILNQNPRFSAGISDFVYAYCLSIMSTTKVDPAAATLVSNTKMRNILQGIFYSYYLEDSDVCFNTNRQWTSSMSLLNTLFPDFKMIICVRNIVEILNSFEHLERKNPLTLKSCYEKAPTSDVYHRTRLLIENKGVVGSSYLSLKQCLTSDNLDKVLFIEYKTLAKFPEEVLKVVYNFLEEPLYEHDFTNLEASYDEFDKETGFEGLHTIRNRVEYMPKQLILPPDIVQEHKESSFWELDSFNTNSLNWIKERV